MRVEIEYCVACGYLDRAVEIQRGLLEAYSNQLEGVFLRPGHSGVFKVRVDDELALDAQEEGFDLDRVYKEIDERLPV